MIEVGLLGWPVGHSRSPAMHRAAFASAGIEGRYELVPAPPDALADAFARCREAGWRGVNVTIPHKERVLHLCDAVDPMAKRVGAVNTVTFDGGNALGSNTDVAGFSKALFHVSGFEPSGAHALVLGAGGAARAVVVGLQDLGAGRIQVANRDPVRAQALARELGVEAVPLSSVEEHTPVLIVNATSVGLDGRPTPFFDRLPFARCYLAYDVIYAPPVRSPFLQVAYRHRCRCVDGRGMLAWQGALAFERWTGVSAASVVWAMVAAIS